MKSYAKVVEAIQYLKGDSEELELIQEFTLDSAVEKQGNDLIITNSPDDKWRVVYGDYIVKDFKGIVVYKASRFEEEFQEVFDSEQDIPETEFAPVVNNYVAGIDPYKEEGGAPATNGIQDQIESKDLASQKLKEENKKAPAKKEDK